MIYDYFTPLERFRDNLQELAAHIREHGIHECSEDDADQIDYAVKLLNGLLTPPQWGSLEGERASFQEAFAYIGDHIQEWAC